MLRKRPAARFVETEMLYFERVPFPRVIIVHPVNVRPYLYFLCADGSADERCRIVLCRPVSGYPFHYKHFADVPLSNKKIDAGYCVNCACSFSSIYFKSGSPSGPVRIKSEGGEQDIGNLPFPQVEVQQGCTDAPLVPKPFSSTEVNSSLINCHSCWKRSRI